MRTTTPPAATAALVGLVLLATSACDRDPPPPPRDCPLPPGTKPIREARSAGCAVIVDGGMMVIRHNDPGKLRHGHISPPGGSVEAGEAARCAAARETLEESGVRVAPGRLLHRFENGFHLFRCAPLDETQAKLAHLRAVPESSREEVLEKVIVDPETMRVRQTGQIEQWAYPSNRVITRRWSSFVAEKPAEAAGALHARRR